MTRNTAAKRGSSEKKTKNIEETRENIPCMGTKVSIEERRGSKVEKGSILAC